MCFLSSGLQYLDKATVSRYVGVNSMPHFSALWRMNPMSKEALCATNTQSPAKSRNFGSTMEISGASATISSVMPVSSVILVLICVPGFTKLSKVSSISPFLYNTAPISVMAQSFAESPVVSISNTQKVSLLRSEFLPPNTAVAVSSTK